MEKHMCCPCFNENPATTGDGLRQKLESVDQRKNTSVEDTIFFTVKICERILNLSTLRPQQVKSVSVSEKNSPHGCS